MDCDFALHITWTTYGSWLPGDARGYVSNTLTPQAGYAARRNEVGTPYTKNDALTRSRSRDLQQRPTIYLDSSLARVVTTALVEAAAKRSWFIAQAAVMRTHVHVVVRNAPADGPAVRRILKGTTQARLSGFVGESRRWWTTGGSDRYKNDPQAVENAVHYVARQTDMLAGIVAMQCFTPPQK